MELQDGFIREKNLLPKIGLSHATLWDMVAKGNFPSPYRHSQRITAWSILEVEQWIKQIKKESAVIKPNGIKKKSL
ncbi:hypothetical protein AOC10_06190 [Polynucleobacter asymbioticus]|uniref:helix-turn-helix transcriptional regulator n=1 Tax=Polynucleobacter asymbioticus TaxID=576611 RepID=UPI0008FB5341|nr:AlpA family phage regulatory protein [Polynucleobacter asymbioticus]APC06139.1 hypothetical protein AOC10_06190 [Polynucleobacter asymbioticus]